MAFEEDREEEGVSNTKHMKRFKWEYKQISQDFAVFLNLKCINLEGANKKNEI